jgi:hypothetical protein
MSEGGLMEAYLRLEVAGKHLRVSVNVHVKKETQRVMTIDATMIK